MKLRRKHVDEKYRGQLDALYTSGQTVSGG